MLRIDHAHREQALSLRLNYSRTIRVLAGVGFLASGILLLAKPSQDFAGQYLPSAALLLILCGLTWIGLSSVSDTAHAKAAVRFQWLRAEAVGVLLCLFVGLLIGNEPSGIVLAVALSCAWMTTLWAGWVRYPKEFARISVAIRTAIPRRFVQGSMVLLAVFGICEAGLRIQEGLGGFSIGDRLQVRKLKFPAGEVVNGRTVNELGCWDDSFSPERTPGVMRLAVLGDDAVLSGNMRTNCVELLEQELPGTELYNFSLCGAGTGEYAAVFEQDASAYQPDMVLLFLSVGDDLNPEGHSAGWLHWSSLRIVQWAQSALDYPGQESTGTITVSQANAYEDCLQALATRLSVCRLPVTHDMESAWQHALRDLERLSRRCESREIPLAIVVVPSAYQVDDRLRRDLCLRQGLTKENLDLELPQRRLSVFAAAHRVGLVDLLPYLQRSKAPVFDAQKDRLNERGHRLACDAVSKWLHARLATKVAKRGP